MKTTMREMRRPCSSIISLSITIQQLIKKIRLFLKNNKLIAYQIIHPPTKLSRGKIDGQMRTGVNLPLHRNGPTSGELPERFFNIIILQLLHWPDVPLPHFSLLLVSYVSCSWLSWLSSGASSHLHQPRCSLMV